MTRVVLFVIFSIAMLGGLAMLISGVIGMYTNGTQKIALKKSPKHETVLEQTAKSEHELGWVPHGDRDVLNACQDPDCRVASGRSRYRLRQVP